MRVFALAITCLLTSGLSYAQPANLDKAQPPPPHTNNKPTHTKEIGEIGKAVQPASPSMPTTVNITVGGNLKLAPDMEEAKTPEKEHERFSELFNVKATDYVIAAFTIVIGVYTIFLTKATRRLAHISSQQEQSTRTIERAYVSMTHRLPGLVHLPPPDSVLGFTVDMRNVGQTPATITDSVLNILILREAGQLPPVPPYTNSGIQPPSAFLYKDGFVEGERRFPVSIEDWEDLNSGAKRLILIGYVDYIDQFGQRYRSGYAGRFDPRSPDNNLLAVITRGYNYDRKRQQGEGNDWGETYPA
jgi:hypothetical protein